MKKPTKILIMEILVWSIISCIISSVIVFAGEGYDGLGPVKLTGKRDLQWPAPNYYNIQSCFYDHRNHQAIDISAPSETPVVASYAGKVIEVQDSNDGYGKHVVLSHNYTLFNGTTTTLYTKYNHLNSYAVSVNQSVARGQKIGGIGMTGSAEGNHLDFQTLIGGWAKTNSIDPYSNQLLELPSSIVVYDEWDCGPDYLKKVKDIYNKPLDNTKPVVSDVRISEVSSDGYRVTCTVTDNIGVKTVKFPTWTARVVNGKNQDDLVWHIGSISGNTATFYVKRSDHNNEYGVYYTDVYAYDAAGNESARVSTSAELKDPRLENDSNIPVATIETGTHIYELYDYSLSWEEARQFCNKRDGHLVTITDAAENELLTSLIKKGTKGLYYIGCTDPGVDGNWRWVTGESFSYTNWDPQAPEPTQSQGETVASIIAIDNPPNKQTGEWLDNLNKDEAPGFYNYANEGFICEYDIDDQTPIYTGIFGKNKYEVYDFGTSWDNAEAFCERKGGHLVTITEEEENSFVNSIIKKGTRGYYHIGFTDVETEGEWKWVTGEKTGYSNWDPQGEPSGGRAENFCMIVSKDNPPNKQSGEWVDMPIQSQDIGYYNYRNSGFVCEYETNEKDISECIITVNPDSFTYTGSENIPVISVKDGDILLAEKSDYSIAISDNVDAGDAVITITGLGQYTGSVEKSFKIQKATQDLKISIESQVIKEGDSLKIDAEGIGTITYTSSDEEIATVDEYGTVFGKKEGEATITIDASGDKNYKAANGVIEISVQKQQPQSILVEFDAGSKFTGDLSGHVKSVVPGDIYGTLPSISLRGYTMLGWFTDPESGEMITSNSTVAIENSHILYAHWEPKSFEIQFNANMDDVENPPSKEVVFDLPIGELPIVSKSGYIFEGWYDQSGKRVDENTLADYQSLTARWIKDAHEHVYSEELTKEATCLTPGVKTFTCICGDKYTEDIPAKGHTEATIMGRAATCEEDGLTYGIKCLVCGEVLIDQVTIKSTGHQFGEWETVESGSCEGVGSEKRTCAVCGLTETNNLNPEGHTWSEDFTIDKEASCTETGSKSIHCLKCNAVKDSTVIKALGHAYGEWVIVEEGSCTVAGKREKKCGTCGDIVTEIIPAGHQWESAFTIDKPATCTEEGSKSIHCNLCGEKKDVKPVKAAGHVWEKYYTVDKEATEEEEGSASIHCEVCGEIQEGSVRAIEKLPKKTTPSLTPTPTATPTPTVTPTPTAAPTPTIAPEQKSEDGTAVGKGASKQSAAAAITAASSDEGPTGTSFALLQPRVKKTTKSSIRIAWAKVPGAVEYIVYGAPCGSAYKEIQHVRTTSYTQKKLKKATSYKYMVMAVSASDTVLATSKTLHIMTDGGKRGNYKSVKVNKKSVTLAKKGKTFKIKAKAVAKPGKTVKAHRKLAYESSDPAIATVSKSGKIKAVKKGKCNVFVYAADGTFAKIKVIVKK